MSPTQLLTVLLPLVGSASALLTTEELHNHYHEIFPTGNRNAASHRWASYILAQSESLPLETLTGLFASFCPVSGSPVRPNDANRYHYTLESLAGGTASGYMHHCCAPCVCDTTDYLKADTKTIHTAEGAHTINVVVLGDPCKHAGSLTRPFSDPFSGESTSLTVTAPELACDAAGHLTNAVFSDNGGVIVGLLAPLDSSKPMQQSTEYAGFCESRAEHNFASGMGLIFRKAAEISPLGSASGRAMLPALPVMAPAPACSGIIPAARMAEIERLVASEPVLMLGMPHMRCTVAAAERLESTSACFKWEQWSEREDPLWKYLQCLHPDEMVGGMQMHSYLYIGGEYIGNGFKLGSMADATLDSKLKAAGAKLSCGKDCTASATAEQLAQLERMKAGPLALIGWQGCPCTGIARKRFESRGACYTELVWPQPPAEDKNLYKYLQCVYGSHHHSFVFFGGKFVGDGFALEAARMPEARFDQLLASSDAMLSCQKEGDKSLLATPLQSCTQSNDGSTTGWTRSGSCVWEDNDSGYHQVCVTMSDEFLRASARHDGNDLSSVVQAGGHWCICAWAWASAVQRDPQAYEGIHLECERTNKRLRQVYQSFIDAGADLRSPSGAAYKAKEALDAVNKLCPESAPALPAPAPEPAAAAVPAAAAAVMLQQGPPEAPSETPSAAKASAAKASAAKASAAKKASAAVELAAEESLAERPARKPKGERAHGGHSLMPLLLAGAAVLVLALMVFRQQAAMREAARRSRLFGEDCFGAFPTHSSSAQPKGSEEIQIKAMKRLMDEQSDCATVISIEKTPATNSPGFV